MTINRDLDQSVRGAGMFDPCNSLSETNRLIGMLSQESGEQDPVLSIENIDKENNNVDW